MLSDTCAAQRTADDGDTTSAGAPGQGISSTRVFRLAKRDGRAILLQTEYLMAMKSAQLAALAAGLCCSAIAAYAASPTEIVAARQANFKQMGKGMKAIIDQIKSPTPAFDAIKVGAAAIDQAAGKVPGYFPPGSGPQSGVKTGALPAIWEKNDEFKSDAGKLIKASAAMRVAAAGGNIDAVKAQFTALGATCKECHQNFRAHDD